MAINIKIKYFVKIFSVLMDIFNNFILFFIFETYDT